MLPDTEHADVSNAGSGAADGTTSGDSELDTLLNEYQDGTKPKAPEPTVVKPDLSELQPIIRFAEGEMQKTQREAFDKDVDTAVDTLAGDDDFQHVPKTLTRRMLIAYAVDNKDFDNAFEKRAQDPAAWGAALEKARSDLAPEVKGFQFANDRGDIEAAAATVADTTTDTTGKNDGPSVADMAKMSDTAWRQFLDEELAKKAS